jgi:hypothetical protein
MTQYAPWPHDLFDLVAELHYREHLGWQVDLVDMARDMDGDRPAAGGLTLRVLRAGPDAYHPERQLRVYHLFPVPPAAFDRRSWQRWLFDTLGKVDDHERMEDFAVAGARPYAPSHGPGNDPYVVRELATAEDQRTSFGGLLNPGPAPGLAGDDSIDPGEAAYLEYGRATGGRTHDGRPLLEWGRLGSRTQEAWRAAARAVAALARSAAYAADRDTGRDAGGG